VESRELFQSTPPNHHARIEHQCSRGRWFRDRVAEIAEMGVDQFVVVSLELLVGRLRIQLFGGR